MCYYSVSAKARDERARTNEELLLRHLPGSHGVKGFVSLGEVERKEPVCMLDKTQLRYQGLVANNNPELPFEGEAEFRTGFDDWTPDVLILQDGHKVRLMDLEPGLQVRVISVPVAMGGEVGRQQSQPAAREQVAVPVQR